MSYQVDHEISFTGNEPAFDALLSVFKGDVEKIVSQISGKNYLFYGEGVYEDEMDEAILPISKQFPTITFKVTSKWEQGMGGDVYDTYYLNGKMVRYKGVMTMPEFNPEDLK